MNNRRVELLLLATVLLPLSALADTPSWPAFRGPNSSGVNAGARPPLRIGPDEGVIWKVEVPWSPSSLCIWADHIFLTTFVERKLETRAYARADGRLLWSRVAPTETLEEFHATEGSPAAATPVTDGRRVVSYFGSFGLVCHDFDGRELWRQRLPVIVTAGNFGSGTSPAISGETVILLRDQATGSSVMAFDLQSGRKLWETLRPDSPTSYGTPVLWQHDGREEVIVGGSLSLKAYEPATGAERWVVRGLPSFTCTTPVVGDGLLFYAGWAPGKSDSPWPSWESTVGPQDKDGDGKLSVSEFAAGPAWFKAQDIDGDGFVTRQDWDTIGGLMKRGENVLLAIKPGGAGDVTASHVAWKFGRGLPYVPSPLFYDGRVYLVRDGGIFSCFDAKTGREFYVEERLPARGSYYASPVAADGRVYLAALDGKVTVIKAGGDKPEVLHEAAFGERIAGTPALLEENLYLRTQTKLYAFGNARRR